MLGPRPDAEWLLHVARFVTLIVSEAWTESFSFPLALQGSLSQEFPAGQEDLKVSHALGTGCLSAQLCPHHPWAFPDKLACTIHTRDKTEEIRMNQWP